MSHTPDTTDADGHSVVDSHAENSVSIAMEDFDQDAKFSEFMITEPLATVGAYTSGLRVRPNINELLAGSRVTATPYTKARADRKLRIMHALSDGPLEADHSGQSGWFLGVFVRVSVSIFGVIMFLRMNWMVGEAGLGLSLLVVAISTFITITVAFSISALCTNGQLLGGGPYYIISRSLGIEAGQVIGMVDFWGQAFSIALNNVGFAETFVSLYSPNFFTGDEDWDKVVVACAATIILVVIACFGVDWLNKLNAVFLGCIMLGVLMFFIGTIADSPGHVSGFTGYRTSTFADNWGPTFANSDFLEVCGVFFPAVTGVLQGAYVSGDLRNPSRDIPFGTISAIIFTISTYVFLMILCAFTATSEALADIDTQNYMLEIAVARPLLTAAIFCAALSTSLCLISGAPRVLVATLKDGMFPRLNFLTVLSKAGEPIRGYVLSGVIAIIVTVFTSGNLNIIAPIVTNLFIVEYIVINVACFMASYSRAPSWRPVFQYYNKWLVLSGVIACSIFTFVVSWISALIVLGLVMGLYQWVRYKKPNFNVGDSTDAAAFRFAVKSVLSLQTRMKASEEKNYRPSFLLLSNYSFHLPQMRKLLSQFYKGHGLFVQGEVIQDELNSRSVRQLASRSQSSQLSTRVTAIHNYVIHPNIRDGVSCMLQSHGLGRVCCNVLMMEFPNEYRTSQAHLVDNYVHVVRDAMQLHFAVVVVRHPDLSRVWSAPDHFSTATVDRDLPRLSPELQPKLLLADAITELDPTVPQPPPLSLSPALLDAFPHEPSPLSSQPASARTHATRTHSDVELRPVSAINGSAPSQAVDMSVASALGPSTVPEAALPVSASGETMPRPIRHGSSAAMLPVEQDRRSLQRTGSLRITLRGTVDVHMLADDGGLPLLLAYLLLKNRRWAKCSIRLFVPERVGQSYVTTVEDITKLLGVLRIEAEAFVLPRNTTEPASDVFDSYAGAIEHASHEARMTFITMPVPHAGASATSFLRTLDVLSARLQGPVLLVRGNQQNVLTQSS